MTIQTKTAHASNYKAASRSAANIGFIVVHYTGNRGDTAKNNADYYARTAGLEASAHYFVDEREVWQSVPDKDVAWHVGARSYVHKTCRNANSIGVEICMLDKAGRVRQRSIDNAALLVRSLMAKYGITSARVLRHYDVTGKDCPAPMVADPKLWAAFKQAVTKPEKIEEEDDMYTVYKTIQDVPDWARECVNDLIAKGYLKGDGDGQLDLEHYMLRGLVVNWRAGLYK